MRNWIFVGLPAEILLHLKVETSKWKLYYFDIFQIFRLKNILAVRSIFISLNVKCTTIIEIEDGDSRVLYSQIRNHEIKES